MFGFLVPDPSFLCLVLTAGRRGRNLLPKQSMLVGKPLSCSSGFAKDPNDDLGHLSQYCQWEQEVVYHQHISTQEHPEMRQLNLSCFPHLIFLKILAWLPASSLCKQRSQLESYKLKSPRSQDAGFQQGISARIDQIEDKEEWWERP